MTLPSLLSPSTDSESQAGATDPLFERPTLPFGHKVEEAGLWERRKRGVTEVVVVVVLKGSKR